MTRQRWFELLEQCDQIQREDDILAAKDDLADLVRSVLLELRPLNAAEEAATIKK